MNDNWEQVKKRFDEMFAGRLSLGSEPFNDAYVSMFVKPLLLKFVHQELSSQKATIREKVETLRHTYIADAMNGKVESLFPYDKACVDILLLPELQVEDSK